MRRKRFRCFPTAPLQRFEGVIFRRTNKRTCDSQSQESSLKEKSLVHLHLSSCRHHHHSFEMKITKKEKEK